MLGRWHVRHAGRGQLCRGVYGLAKALAFEGREHDISLSHDDCRATPTGSTWTRLSLRCSPACSVTGEAFAAGIARVFVAETPGWVAPDAASVSPDDILEHLDEIRSQDGYEVPDDLYQEIELFARALGWQPSSAEQGR